MTKYKIYNNDGELLAEGVRQEILDKMGWTHNQLLYQIKMQNDYKISREISSEYKRKTFVWFLLDENENKVIEGPITSICSKMGCDRNSVTNAFYQKFRLLGKYKVDRRQVKGKVTVTKSKKDERYEEILRDLKIYGNTITVEEPTKVIDWLSMKGMNVKARHVPEKTIQPANSYEQPLKSEEFWVLEERYV